MSYRIGANVLPETTVSFFMANYQHKFSKLYDKQVERIYRFIFLKVGSRETAEDLTAQVFTKGWERFRLGQKIKNPSAYLFQIARSKVADYYRSSSKYQFVSTEANFVVDPSPLPEQTEQKKSDIEELQKYLGELQNDYQDVLILRYINDCSYKEIARVMARTEGAARVLVHRALKELRGRYESAR